MYIKCTIYILPEHNSQEGFTFIYLTCPFINTFFYLFTPGAQMCVGQDTPNVVLSGCTFWNELLAVVCHPMCVQQDPCVL